jgi:hypothetical protein
LPFQLFERHKRARHQDLRFGALVVQAQRFGEAGRCFFVALQANENFSQRQQRGGIAGLALQNPAGTRFALRPTARLPRG